MKSMALCGILIAALMGTVFGGQLSRIELTDGSVIEAEVTSFDDGIYSLSSGSLGQIKIPASKIRRIEISLPGPQLPQAVAPAVLPTAPAAPNAIGSTQATQNSSNSEYKTKMDSMAASIKNNPEVMDSVASLATDPAFQDMLNDPDIIAKVQAGDVQSLMNNPKFMNAIKNPKIKEIHDKINQ